jgi:RimJ/RimL family protein N-acetyltransferase
MVIEIRDVLEGDLPILFEHQRDPAANAMAAFPARDRDTFFAHWKKVLDDPSVITTTITADGEVAGNIAAFERAGRRLVGYWIGRQYWGRGIATQALAAFLRQFRPRPVYAYVAKHNVGSIRVLEKCGFVVSEAPPPGEDGVEELLMVLVR